MRKQFDLQYYLDHPDVRVVTRDGRSVRILCTDTKSTQGFVITALLDYGDLEMPLTYDPLGAHGTTHELDIDLFFDLPEPEKKKVPLTYEDLIQRIETGKTMWMQLEYAPGCYRAFNIISFNHVGIKYEEGLMRYNDLVNNRFTFINGDLCWKEIEK